MRPSSPLAGSRTGRSCCVRTGSHRPSWPTKCWLRLACARLTDAAGGSPRFRRRRRLHAVTGRLAALVALEPDEPVEPVTVDDLPIGCTPRPLLQVVHDPAPFAETGKPGAQSRGSGRAQQGQHHAFGSDGPLVPGHVGAGQCDGSPGQVAVGDGIGRTVGPVELRVGVQLNCTAKDVTVERQGLTSSAREEDIGPRVSHGSDVIDRWPPGAFRAVLLRPAPACPLSWSFDGRPERDSNARPTSWEALPRRRPTGWVWLDVPSGCVGSG